MLFHFVVFSRTISAFIYCIVAFDFCMLFDVLQCFLLFLFPFGHTIYFISHPQRGSGATAADIMRQDHGEYMAIKILVCPPYLSKRMLANGGGGSHWNWATIPIR